MTGRYFEDCRPAEAQPEPTAGGTGVAAWAIDEASAERLWEDTRKELGY